MLCFTEEKMEGTVKFFNRKKGFGFVHGDDEQDYFVHFTNVAKGTFLRDNDRVSFDSAEGDRGLKAENVQLLQKGSERDDLPAEEPMQEEAPVDEASEEQAPAEEPTEEPAQEEAPVEETTEEQAPAEESTEEPAQEESAPEEETTEEEPKQE